MRKFRFRSVHRFGPVESIKAPVMHENCSSLIEDIESIFSKHGAVMSPEDQNQILAMLKQIEKKEKCIKCSEKKEMYRALDAMWKKYSHRAR